ncbi:MULTISPECIES: nitrilase-related carbon-nitrogen hydrolase [unclassified Arthrobacter]|uniref:nitrilase-related carbon-nitrogen hydrolase n=1 Tax=unclassified Arthrobacter TaxID=235627 RepID=UPI001F4333F0|nr:nitrilase-related carbon-nitrogen hydrolase [Arthrobacter sp. FW305-BF8]UKA55602.1 nitrilase [Arthrobacter sp. FW305-BF8]
MITVKLALMQGNSGVLDIARNCEAIDRAARTAAEAGAGVLLTPELFPVGYAPLRVRAELETDALPGVRRTLAGIAARYQIALVYSLPAVTAGGQWQITATVLDSGGNELLSYAKVHLFGPEERKVFSPAEAAPAVVDLGGIKTSLAICYDVEFPETVRAAAAAGADLLVVPTALAHGFESVPQVLLRARALESQLTVAYANHSGEEDGCTFLGGSVIAGPDGELLATAGAGPELLFAEVSAEAARQARDAVPYLRERRPDVYRAWDEAAGGHSQG